MPTILEIAKKNSSGGRRKIKLALHEIYNECSDVNKNGLHWKEEYVLQNIDSAINMPLCAEFVDDEKEMPFGHGLTGIDVSENEPVFENSEVVGTVTKAYIDTININGADKKALVAEGYIYQQRYPKFTKWLEKNINESCVMSSIEIMGKPENNNLILYEEDEPTQDFRTPKSYLYSGSALLSVEPADDTAKVLQMNSLNNKNKIKESEDSIVMDKETLATITDAVKGAVTETNSKNAEYEKQITELNQSIAEKDNTITELNNSVAEIQKSLDAAVAEKEGIVSEIETLKTQLNEAKVKEKIAEMNTAIAGFTDEQKAFAKDEIEKFNADPMNVEINSILTAIYCGIGKNAMQTKTDSTVEINSADIYSEVIQPENKVGNDTEVSIY